MKLRITVRDTGPGIPEIEQHVIFDAFRQVDGSSTRSHGGLGVGLSTAKRLAGLMKAELKLEETSTEGSTFVSPGRAHSTQRREPCRFGQAQSD